MVSGAAAFQFSILGFSQSLTLNFRFQRSPASRVETRILPLPFYFSHFSFSCDSSAAVRRQKLVTPQNYIYTNKRPSVCCEMSEKIRPPQTPSSLSEFQSESPTPAPLDLDPSG